MWLSEKQLEIFKQEIKDELRQEIVEELIVDESLFKQIFNAFIEKKAKQSIHDFYFDPTYHHYTHSLLYQIEILTNKILKESEMKFAATFAETYTKDYVINMCETKIREVFSSEYAEITQNVSTDIVNKLFNK